MLTGFTATGPTNHPGSTTEPGQTTRGNEVTDQESRKRLLNTVADLNDRLAKIESKIDVLVAINAPTPRTAAMALASAAKIAADSTTEAS